MTSITEIPAKDGKLYVSALFDCFDAAVLGLSMADNMRSELCVQTLSNACLSYAGLRGAIVHSDRGSQYTSEKYRLAISKCGIRQSMNSAGGRCHDNARCESMWARMKEELFYSRNESTPSKRVKLVNQIFDEIKQSVVPIRPNRSVPRPSAPRDMRFYHNYKNNS